MEVVNADLDAVLGDDGSAKTACASAPGFEIVVERAAEDASEGIGWFNAVLFRATAEHQADVGDTAVVADPGRGLDWESASVVPVMGKVCPGRGLA